MLKKTRDAALYLRVLSLLFLDALMINASVLASLLIRFEFSIQALSAAGFVENYLRIAPLFTLISLLFFSVFRLYRSLWAYASIEELAFILMAVLSSDLALILIPKLSGVYLPRSLPVINIFLHIGFTLAQQLYGFE